MRKIFTKLANRFQSDFMSVIKIWLFLVLFYCIPLVAIEFHSVPVGNLKSMLITFSQFAVITASASALILLLTLNRYVFSVTFPIVATISTIVSYYHLTMGVTLTPVAIELALVNDASMWMSVITASLTILILLTWCVCTALIYLRFKCHQLPQKYLLPALVAGIIVGIAPAACIDRLKAPLRARLPFSIYYSTIDYLANKKAISEDRDTYAETTAYTSANSPTLIFVIGESLRSDHIPQNGYSRNTMPKLTDIANVVSFDSIYTEHTYTYTSVPHLLTDQTSDDEDAAYHNQSFVTLLKKAGYRTAWFANQDLSDSYTYFAHECDTLFYGKSSNSLYSYNKWLDADMLPQIHKWIIGHKSPGLKAAMIHCIGSHWWYKSHYLDRHATFKPETDSKDVGALTDEQMVNSYDNTIIATDEFLFSIIKMLETENAVLFYISDHGESLGEDGVYLHARETGPLHRPACLVWYSSRFEELFPQKTKLLKLNRHNTYTTQTVFHTILDLADINTDAYQPAESMLHDRHAD